MGKIVGDLILGIVILFGIAYFITWRVFFSVGKVVDKELHKIKAEATKEDYEELEKKHLGDVEKQTGIYHPDVIQLDKTNTKQVGGKD